MSALLSVIAASRRPAGGGGGFTLGWEPVQKFLDAPYADDLIATEGVLVWGRSVSGQTVNGVTFSLVTHYANFSFFGNNGVSSPSGPGLSAAMTAFLSAVTWSQDNPPASILLNGLTPGKTYLVQLCVYVWFGDQSYTMTLQGQSVTGYPSNQYQSYVCRFVAAGTTELITNVQSGSTAYSYFGLNGMQLRQLD